MNKDKLLQLADHIEKLDDKLWNYSHYVDVVIDCGTVGCAIGHLPDLWPESWKIVDVGGEPFLKYLGRNHFLMSDCAAAFFDISDDLAYEIFVNMPTGSTKTDVANKIREVCCASRETTDVVQTPETVA